MDKNRKSSGKSFHLVVNRLPFLFRYKLVLERIRKFRAYALVLAGIHSKNQEKRYKKKGGWPFSEEEHLADAVSQEPEGHT